VVERLKNEKSKKKVIDIRGNWHSALILVLALVACILCAPALVGAEELKFSASVDRTAVEAGESLTLNLSVSAEGMSSVPVPKLPAMPDFQVVSSSQSSSFSWVNGKVSASKTFSYTLVPDRMGRLTIPPASLSYGGKTYQTWLRKRQSRSRPSRNRRHRRRGLARAGRMVRGRLRRRTRW
jgi:hypothetical protein